MNLEKLKAWVTSCPQCGCDEPLKEKLIAFVEAAKKHAKFFPTGPHVALDEIDSWAEFLAALDALEDA